MQREKLRQLAEFLKELPEEKFNINSWTSACGATHCAFGWCSVIWPDEIKIDFAGLPNYCGVTGTLAAEWFFEITHWTVVRIFMSNYYPTYNPTKDEVCERILSLANCEEEST